VTFFNSFFVFKDVSRNTEIIFFGDKLKTQ